jgi:hypothetical protein
MPKKLDSKKDCIYKCNINFNHDCKKVCEKINNTIDLCAAAFAGRVSVEGLTKFISTIDIRNYRTESDDRLSAENCSIIARAIADYL